MEPTIENIENYKILNLIGEGSFGKVYRAQDKTAETIVALKILTKVNKLSKYHNKYSISHLILARTPIKGSRESQTRVRNSPETRSSQHHSANQIIRNRERARFCMRICGV